MKLDSGYVVTPFRTAVHVRGIVSVHYFEFSRNWAFVGESHPFWEIVYVDKGEAEITAGERVFTVRAGTMVFHRPEEFHNIHANGVVAPNIVIFAFDCPSPAMEALNGKVLRAGNFEKDILAKALFEAKNAYVSPLDDPWLKKLERRPGAALGSEQLVRIYLELLLLHVLRGGEGYMGRVTKAARQQTEDSLAEDVRGYLSANLYGSLRFDDVCRHFSQSRSGLKQLFHQKTGRGVMEYYRWLKIEEAKKLIREETYNFSGIAELLRFSSEAYFSRCFRGVTGMTPSEYALSVKAKEEHP